MTDTPAALGSRLGPRLADLMTRAVVSSNQQLAGHKVQTSMAFQESFFRLVGSETKRTVGGLSRDLAAMPEAEGWVKDTFAFMGNETGQWSALLNFAAYGSGLSGGLTGIITNEISPLVEKRYAAQPNAVHAPQTLASMVASRIITQADGEGEALKSALSRTRFRQLLTSGEAVPSLDLLMEMRRRGLLDANDVKHFLQRLGFTDALIPRLQTLFEALLQGPDLANLVDRGAISASEAAKRAAFLGIDADDFRLMVELVGVPPATELLMSAYRRGIIDKARLNKGIRQSPLRSEWTDVISELQYDPISTLQAADLRAQNLISVAKGRDIANLNGTKAADFDLLVEGSGRPPGIQEMLDLWNRGEVSEADVRQALLESPLKNKWVDTIMQTRRRIPPQDTVRMFINQGVMSAEDGIKRFMAVGFNAEDSRALAELAQKGKTQSDRELTKAEVMSLYEYRLVSETQAKGMLDQLGYDAGDIALLLALSDFRKSKRELDAVASVIRSKYVAHKITDAECSAALDGAHIPSDARDHLMSLWALERDANQKDLTPAQIINAVKDGFIERAEGMTRLQFQGYDARDADILISHAIGPGT